MAKKNWIYIKRGLSEDPKHRAAMGECVWLYMHIIDRADWETGIAYDWKDAQEAADMGLSVDTLRRQRQKLEEGDYIRCSQKQYKQEIAIIEWKNPRDYSCEVKNPRFQGLNETLPSNEQGLNHGLNHGTRQIKTPTLDSKSLSSDSSNSKKRLPTNSDVAFLLANDQMPTQAEQDGKKQEHDAITSFENAFGIQSSSWLGKWYNGKPEWSRFRKWVTKTWVENNSAFGEYVIFKKNKGKFLSLMDATKIAHNPDDFYTSWDVFIREDKGEDIEMTRLL